MVRGPTGTEMSEVQVPTGMVRVLPAKVKVKLPVTPVPSASLQICRRPVGEAAVAVGAPGVLVGLGVAVGVPAVRLVKMTSVTPVPILMTTFPSVTFLLTTRPSGLTSMRLTTMPAGMVSWTVTCVLSGNCPARTHKPPSLPAGTL